MDVLYPPGMTSIAAGDLPGPYLRIPGDGDQRFPNDRDRDSWMIVISVPTEGDQ